MIIRVPYRSEGFQPQAEGRVTVGVLPGSRAAVSGGIDGCGWAR